MTATDARVGSDELDPNPRNTYDLMICHGDRIVFHDHYDSPQLRLRMCIQLLTASDVVAEVIDAPRAVEVNQLHDSMADLWGTAPDQVANAVAKLCRRWGVQVYVSTTRKKSAAPAALFSVITIYGPGEITAEHFPSITARRRSLIERIQQLSLRLPTPYAAEITLAHQIARLLNAEVLLTETALSDDSSYRPHGRSAHLPVL